MKPITSKSQFLPLLHLVFWFGYILVSYSSARFYGVSEIVARWSTVADILTLPIITYLNLLVFLPKLYEKGKLASYIIVVAVMILSLVYFRSNVVNIILGSDVRQINGFLRLMQFMGFYFLSTTIWFANKSVAASQREVKLQNSKLESDLKFLKLQLSPHFLFNTLNNIYSLVYLRDANAATAVLKLSGMMRHMIYDSQDAFIPLAKEIDFVTNLIELHKIKLEDKRSVTFTHSGINEYDKIAPMIFLVFLENAFKHGTTDSGSITANVTVRDSTLHFYIRNDITKQPSTIEEKSGVGLTNVKQRLQLIYPNKHKLVFQANDNIFEVNLMIQLS